MTPGGCSVLPARLERRAAVRRKEAGARLSAERQRPSGPRAAPGLRELRVPGRPSPLRCKLCGAAAAQGEGVSAAPAARISLPDLAGALQHPRASPGKQSPTFSRNIPESS